MSADQNKTSTPHLVTIDISGTTVPDGVQPEVWAMLLKLDRDGLGHREAQTAINDQFSSKINDLENNQQNTDQSVEQLQTSNAQLHAHVKLLHAKINMLENRVDMNTRQNTDLTARSMQQNIVISVKKGSDRMPENKNENCKSIVEKILTDIMGMDPEKFDVIRAHRLGQFTKDYCRPMVARLGSKSEVFDVLKRGNTLSGTGIFVNKQLPSSTDERRRFCQDYSKFLKTDQPDVTTKLSDGRLFVNGDLNRALLQPSLPPSDEHSIEPLLLTKSLPKTTPTCNFQAIACDIANMQDIRHGLDRAMAESTDIHAIAYAYRFTDRNDKLRENFDSGSALTIGYDLLRDLRNRDSQNTLIMIAMRFNDPLAPAKGLGFKRGLESALGECFG